MYAKAREHAIWVLLIEKAYAKLHGNYKSIEGGQAFEAMRDLTGAPSYVYDINQDGLADKLIQFKEKKYIMVCSSEGSSQSEENLKSLGLLSNFSYSVLDVRQINDKNKKSCTLVKVRNPWGQGEWTGDWSDKSPLWTKSIKKELNWSDKNDGTFWIDF